MTGFLPIFISRLERSAFVGLLVLLATTMSDYLEVYCANCMIGVPLDWTWTGALKENLGWFWVGMSISYGVFTYWSIREQLRTPEASS